jgi:hypothetical protein
MKSIITTSQLGHGYKHGDTIKLTILDMRWYKRLWYFITFRSLPTKLNIL